MERSKDAAATEPGTVFPLMPALIFCAFGFTCDPARIVSLSFAGSRSIPHVASLTEAHPLVVRELDSFLAPGVFLGGLLYTNGNALRRNVP